MFLSSKTDVWGSFSFLKFGIKDKNDKWGNGY